MLVKNVVDMECMRHINSSPEADMFMGAVSRAWKDHGVKPDFQSWKHAIKDKVCGGGKNNEFNKVGSGY